MVRGPGLFKSPASASSATPAPDARTTSQTHAHSLIDERRWGPGEYLWLLRHSANGSDRDRLRVPGLAARRVGSRNQDWSHAAARSYSWISPPRRSLRTIRPAGADAGGSPLGVRRPSPLIWPSLLIALHELAEHEPQVATAKDQEVIRALASTWRSRRPWHALTTRPLSYRML